MMVTSVEPVFKVPWSPHIGILLGLNAHPRNVQGLVVCKPSPLPLEAFKINWELWSSETLKIQLFVKSESQKPYKYNGL